VKNVVVGTLVVAVVAAGAAGAAEYKGPRKSTVTDGSLSGAAHLIPLFTDEWEKILPTDRPAKPFSSKMTCGDCHNYLTVAGGWHFNSSTGMADPGRLGEPWILADDWTGTQIPISYRGWPDIWKPEDLGITQWEFVKRFGHHLPGGDMADKEDDPIDPDARWEISGHVDANCLACHNAAPEQNPTEWTLQLGRENFKWAATASSGLATVRYMAANLPVWFDPYIGNPDNSWAAPPRVDYNPAKFDAKRLVFFNVTKKPPAQRCYYCHSTAPAQLDEATFWHNDQDVHLAAGLTCTDCHRNGIDHNIVRGYEGEPGVSTELSCKGCHLGEKAGLGGRMGAPRPLHKNLPPVHLEKIACTACHSTPVDGFEPERVKTARANRLGIHGAARWDTELPYIQAPVYVRAENGKIEPREMMFPAFWGVLEGSAIKPLPFKVASAAVDEVRWAAEEAAAEAAAAEAAAAEAAAKEAAEKAAVEAAKEAAAETTAQPDDAAATTEEAAVAPEPADTPQAEQPADEEAPAEEPEPEPEPEVIIEPLTEQQIVLVLAGLAKTIEGEPVYVAGGKAYKLDGENLAPFDNPAGEPRSWAVAHDVKPAAEALGAKGCTDCHAAEAPFFFASLDPAAPTPIGAPAKLTMIQFQQLDPAFVNALQAGVFLRYVFVAVSVALAIVLALALAHYGFTAIEGLARIIVSTHSRQNR